MYLTYTRYRAAFCHTGLPSTIREKDWTKSRNMHMNGASMRMTIQPARICQMPATMHRGSVVNGKKAMKPKMMAPEKYKIIEKFEKM